MGIIFDQISSGENEMVVFSIMFSGLAFKIGLFKIEFCKVLLLGSFLMAGNGASLQASRRGSSVG